MSQALAQIADLNQSDEKMQDLTFTSHLRFNSALGSVRVNSVTLNSDIFGIESRSDASGEAGIDITCALREDWISVSSGQSLVQKLREPMTFTGELTVTGSQLDAVLAEGQSALYAVGWNTIQGIPGSGLGGEQVQVPAVTYTLPIHVSGDLTVVVEDENGNRLKDAIVTLTLITNSAQDAWQSTKTTDSTGWVSFSDVEYGTYRIDVTYSHTLPGETGSHQHHATKTGIFHTSSQTVTMTIQLDTRVEINTRVESNVTGSQEQQLASAADLEQVADIVDRPSVPAGGKQTVDVVLNVVKTDNGDSAAIEIVNEVDDAVYVADPESVTADNQIAITDFIDATITATTKTEDSAGNTTSTSESIKNTGSLVSIYIPVPDNMLELLAAHGLTTGAIRVFRHHEPQDGRSDVEELDRIGQSDSREGFYTIALTNSGETREYVVIKAEKFSVYAFGVRLASQPEEEPGQTVIPAPDQGGSGDQGGGSGGSGGVTRYPVDVSDSIVNGSVTSSHDRTTEGTRVTITVKPDDGYRLNSLTVTDKDGNRIALTANADGTYTFIMPDSGVEVNANFSAAIADPADTGVADWLNTTDHTAYIYGFTDGDFGPGQNVTRAQVAAMFYRLLKNQNVASSASFSDVPAGAWYEDAVKTLAALGVITGYSDGTFRPNEPITRAQFSAIAVRFTDTAAESPLTFTDVPESYWAHDYIATAAGYGWVSGYGDGTFGPYDHITRAQTAVIINRMTGRLADRVAIDAGEGERFPDVPKTYWAWYDIIEATTTHDYTKGSGMETWRR